MLQTIISAIEKNEVLSFTYEGQPREVEPHAVGVSTGGYKVLRCFQVNGHQQHEHSWDLVPLSKIADLSTTKQKFDGTRSGYKSGDKGMTTIYAHV